MILDRNVLENMGCDFNYAYKEDSILETLREQSSTIALIF